MHFEIKQFLNQFTIIEKEAQSFKDNKLLTAAKPLKERSTYARMAQNTGNGSLFSF